MKSIGHVSFCSKTAPWVVCSTSIKAAIALCLITRRVSHVVCQTALQAASSLISEKLNNRPYTTFPYQAIQGQNIPLEPTRIEIWANNPPNQNKWLILLLFPQSYLTHLFLLCLSETLNSFLHASTPERRTRAFAHLFKESTHGQGQHPKKHILQKNVQDAETLRNDTSGGASEPHRSKYMRLHFCFTLFIV
jgi:hypothetical protein